jgi:hypothetical protein
MIFTIVLQWSFSIASKHNFDDQFFLLSTVHTYNKNEIFTDYILGYIECFQMLPHLV